MSTRLERDEFFMRVAELAAQRSTCERLHAGCVIVGEKKIIAVGYNSSHRGTPHCEEVGCLMEEGHCTRCLHAEEAAIINIETRRFHSMIAYITHPPCIRCYKLLTSAGVQAIVYRTHYEEASPALQTLVKEIGVKIIQHGR